MKRILVPLAAVLAVLAATASPAGASSAAARADSGICWAGLDRLLTAAANARGGLVREKATKDTPAERSPTSGCPDGKDTCLDEPGLDPIHNYMDYSFDSCYSEFTPGQTARMQDQWLFFRAGH